TCKTAFPPKVHRRVKDATNSYALRGWLVEDKMWKTAHAPGAHVRFGKMTFHSDLRKASNLTVGSPDSSVKPPSGGGVCQGRSRRWLELCPRWPPCARRASCRMALLAAKLLSQGDALFPFAAP